MADDTIRTAFEELENQTPYDRFCLEIKLSEHMLENFHKRGDKLIGKYRVEDARSEDGDMTRGRNPYHVFWANVQTLQPALYSRTPKPRVSRRYKDKDVVGRVAAEILERAVTFMMKAEDFDDKITGARDDLLIPGLGQCWVNYQAKFLQDPEEGKMVTGELSKTKYQYWKDFLWSPARRWEDVRWVAKRMYVTKEQARKRWKGRAEGLSYELEPKAAEDHEDFKDKQLLKKACVYELWDKETRKIYWFSINDDAQDFLQEKKDFLKLRSFFPCPKPLFATTTTSTLVPIADYDMYAEQAELLRDIQIQIDYLIRATKVAGVYDKNCDEIATLLSDDIRNEMIPAENWPMLAQQGGLKGATDFLDLTAITNALQVLYQSQKDTLARMYEVTGLSDIIRGQSNPYETAAAQQTKAQYATLRIQDRQKEVQRFVRDIIRIHAEIISEHIDEDVLRRMTGVDFMTEFANDPQQAEQLYKAAVELLKKDRLRSFRIEIETDSTISPDRAQEKQQRIELLTAITQFLQAGLAVGSQEKALAPAMGEMLLYGVRAFEGGRDMESSLEEAIDRIKMQLQQPPPPPPPDPQMLKVQQDGQIKTKELELKAQELQLDAKRLEIEMYKAQVEAKIAEAQHQLDAIRIQGALQIDAQKVQQDASEASRKAQMEAAKVQQSAQKIAQDAQIAAAKLKQDDYRIHNEAVKTKQESQKIAKETRKDLSEAVLKDRELNIKEKDTQVKAAAAINKAENPTSDKE